MARGKNYETNISFSTNLKNICRCDIIRKRPYAEISLALIIALTVGSILELNSASVIKPSSFIIIMMNSIITGTRYTNYDRVITCGNIRALRTS